MQIRDRFVFVIILTLALSSASVCLAQVDPLDVGANSLPGMVYWNGIDKEAITTESGLQYKVLHEGVAVNRIQRTLSVCITVAFY